MSLSEAPTVMLGRNGTPQSTPGPDELTPGLSLAQHNEILKAEALRFRLELDEVNLRLLHARVCHQTEAQSRHTMQRGLDALQQSYIQSINSYKSIYEQLGRDKSKLQEDIRITEELNASQKQYIDLLQTHTQQQQHSAERSSQDAPMSSQYNDHSNSGHYPTYIPPRHDFIIDPSNLHQLDDLDYGIGPSIEPLCDPNPVMPTAIIEYDSQFPTVSVQPAQFSTSAERDTPGPNHNGDVSKRVSEDNGAKPSKKRRTK